jgi:hypothetical protein
MPPPIARAEDATANIRSSLIVLTADFGNLRDKRASKAPGVAVLDLMIAGPEGGPSSDMQRYEG